MTLMIWVAPFGDERADIPDSDCERLLEESAGAQDSCADDSYMIL